MKLEAFCILENKCNGWASISVYPMPDTDGSEETSFTDYSE